MSTEAPWSSWFEGRLAIRQLPADCIRDCSAQGDVSEAVDYWIKKLRFEAPPWLLRQHLRGLGAWSSADLCNHRQNLRRLLHGWVCSCRFTNSNHPLYLE